MAEKKYLDKAGIAKLHELIDDDYLAKNQGVGNAGKALVVGSNGIVAPGDVGDVTIVHITSDGGGGLISDMTPQQIYAAITAGHIVIADYMSVAQLRYEHYGEDGMLFHAAVRGADDKVSHMYLLIAYNGDISMTGVIPQSELVSGENIKTLNNASLLGSGNISLTLANIPDDAGHRSVSDAEKTNWDGKQDAIPDETYDDYGAAAAVQDNLDDVTELIPPQATLSNQLADKAFVNSSVQTATANFRGNWDTWAAVPTDATLYPADYAGSKTPTVNDYLVAVDASDYSGLTLEGTWRFKYSGTWATNGKSGWQPEYQVNETPLTAAQLAALNSNVTDGKVSIYDAHVADEDIHVTASQKTEWSGKGEAPTLNTETQTALTPSDNTIYAFTATSAVTITATGSTCPLYGSDIIVTIGTGGSVTLSAVGTAGEDITTAAEGDVWEINILRGYAVCAKIGGTS